MGSRIASRLLDAGHDLVVWNRTPEKAASLLERGAKLAETPAEAARTVDVVITMVADPQALEDITPGLTEAACVIEMSTVGPAAIARLRSAPPENVDLLDAPVLGSIAEAELVVEAAREQGADLRLAEAARSWLAAADDASWRDRDYSALIAWITRPS